MAIVCNSFRNNQISCIVVVGTNLDGVIPWTV